MTTPPLPALARPPLPPPRGVRCPCTKKSRPRCRSWKASRATAFGRARPGRSGVVGEVQGAGGATGPCRDRTSPRRLLLQLQRLRPHLPAARPVLPLWPSRARPPSCARPSRSSRSSTNATSSSCRNSTSWSDDAAFALCGGVARDSFAAAMFAVNVVALTFFVFVLLFV